MKASLSILLLLLVCSNLKAQTLDSIPPEISVADSAGSIHFSAKLRPLRQIAGAPAAFYTYCWELGDGKFSFDKNPVHVYKDTGIYQVRVYATNNYDDGKAPPTRPRPIRIKKKSPGPGAWASHFFKSNGNIEAKINRYPRPNENFLTIIGYRNQYGDSISGSIALFYNERQFGQNAFALDAKRYYNNEDSSSIGALMASTDGPATPTGQHRSLIGEAEAAGGADNTPVPNFAAEARSMLHTMQSTYSHSTVAHFNAIGAGQENFLFMDLTTLPGMIQDTNTTVVLTAIMIPDNPAYPPETFRMEVPVVASHDPNRIDISPRRINYRFMGKKKELTYKIQFQNTGKGPAKKISIGVRIPHQLNMTSVQLRSMNPQCRWCDSAYDRQSCIDTSRSGDSLYFVFNNIYLPGVEQEGVGDKDSTKGYIEYSIRFLKKPKKIPFNTGAAIIFDRNPPVYTNRATAKFIKGISPGIMAGYVYSPANGNYSTKGSLQIGYVLAPFSPFRPYFQIEAFAGLLQEDDHTTGVIRDQKDTAIGAGKFLIVGREVKTILKKNSFEVTPLHYRYNINSWVGVGVGAQVMVNISEQTTTERRAYLTTQLLPPGVVTVAAASQKNSTKYLGTWNAAPFADLQIGRVRTGPTIGLRYLRLLRGDVTNRFFLYAACKL